MKPIVGFAGITHLGLNSAAAAAERGFETVCFDSDFQVIGDLQKCEIPIIEPNLSETLKKNSSRIVYTSSPTDLSRCDVVYISTDVPTDDHGKSDLSPVGSLIDNVKSALGSNTILVILCQVPPGFTRSISFPPERLFYQVETLIFGRAIERAMFPERFIVGCSAPREPLPDAYHAFLSAFECPILPMRYESAELCKIAINCCLVASVSVANTLADLCERIGADWGEITPALRLDRRIGPHAYLTSGLGIGGGNLERDLATVLNLAGTTGSESSVIESFITNSRYRRDWVLRTLHREVLSRKPHAILGILGLAYKENTHSTKNSPSVALINHLSPWQIRVYDPVVSSEVVDHHDVIGCTSAIEVARGADALMIMTPWSAFRDLKSVDIKKEMVGSTVIDPYGLLDGRELVLAGLNYFVLGSPPVRSQVQEEIHA